MCYLIFFALQQRGAPLLVPHSLSAQSRSCNVALFQQYWPSQSETEPSLLYLTAGGGRAVFNRDRYFTEVDGWMFQFQTQGLWDMWIVCKIMCVLLGRSELTESVWKVWKCIWYYVFSSYQIGGVQMTFSQADKKCLFHLVLSYL